MFICKDASVCDDACLNLLACKQMYLLLAYHIKAEWCLPSVCRVWQFYQKMQSSRAAAKGAEILFMPMIKELQRKEV